MAEVNINIDEQTGELTVTGDEPYVRLFTTFWIQHRIQHYMSFMSTPNLQEMLNAAVDISKENREAWMQAEMDGTGGDFEIDPEQS